MLTKNTTLTNNDKVELKIEKNFGNKWCSG
jgi:hypothetical protein